LPPAAAAYQEGSGINRISKRRRKTKTSKRKKATTKKQKRSRTSRRTYRDIFAKKKKE
jgi:hypothetical protein